MTQKKLHQKFDQASSELIQSLTSLNEDQLNQTPFQGSWTAGQLGDHLLKSYGVVDIISGKTATTDRPVDEKIGPIEEALWDFDNKMEAAGHVRPTEGRIEKEWLMSELKKRRDQVLDHLEGNEDHLSRTCLDGEFPGAGTFTREEWIRFMTAHIQRHVRQLKNIMKSL